MVDLREIIHTMGRQLKELIDKYSKLYHKFMEMYYDFGFKYELGDLKKWEYFGKEVEDLKSKILEILSKALEYAEIKCGKMNKREKIIFLCYFIRYSRAFELEQQLADVIAPVVNCNPNYVQKVYKKYRRGKLDLRKSVRAKVLQKFNYSCAICGCKENLVIHHIIPRSTVGLVCPKEILSEDNLIVLCEECHNMFHPFEPYGSKEDFYKIVDLWKELLNQLRLTISSEKQHEVIQILRNEFKHRFSPFGKSPTLYEYELSRLLNDEELEKVKELFEHFCEKLKKELYSS